MPEGLQVWDQSAKLTLDTTDRISRIIGTDTIQLTSFTSGQQFRFNHPFTAGGKPFVYRSNGGNAVMSETNENFDFSPYYYTIAIDATGYTVTIYKATGYPDVTTDTIKLVVGEY